jgi:hypothetical protein
VPDSELLPGPLATTETDPDKLAVSLAGLVDAAGTEQLAALEAAVAASGIGIRDLAANGAVVLQPAEPSQGLAFQAGQVVAMDKLLRQDYRVSLADVGELVRSLDPTVFAKASIAKYLVDGIRTASADKKSATRRFWGRFLVELGRQRSEPSDPLKGHPDDVQLDAVQTFFVLLRLFGDFENKVSASRAAVAGGAASRALAPAAGSAPGATSLPCSMNEREAEILDRASILGSVFFEKLIDYAAEQLEGGALEKFAGKIGYINGALALIKFIATAAAFNAKVEIDGGEPLVRTKDTHAGETRQLKITVRMDTGRSQFLNCMRFFLNGAGLDFSLPSDGPVAGAAISWSLLRGGDPKGYVRFCSLGQSCEGSTSATINPVEGVTDEEGEWATGIQGIPQKRALPDTVAPLERRAVVRASVNLKPSNFWRDIFDAIYTATAGVGAPVAFTTELLYRVGAFGSGLNFAVRDWREQWQINMTVANDDQETASHVEFHWDGTVEVDPETGAISGTGIGSATGHGSKCIGASKVYQTNANLAGSWTVKFGGEKNGDVIDLAVAGIAPAIKATATGRCSAFNDLEELLSTMIAKDPGQIFGVDRFTFKAGDPTSKSVASGHPVSTWTISIDSSLVH